MAKTFTSAEEEIQYWKDRVAVLEKEAADNKEEFEDFQISSRELELELETQLEQSEAKIRDFRSLTNRLEQENDQLKDKLEQCTKEYHYQVSEKKFEKNGGKIKIIFYHCRSPSCKLSLQKSKPSRTSSKSMSEN